MRKQLRKLGCVRVDLVGGTIDLPPICFILENAFTINFATSLQCEVVLEEQEKKVLTLRSLDYDQIFEMDLEQFEKKKEVDYPAQLQFVLRIVKFFSAHFDGGLKIQTHTKLNPGSGLGTSSALGVTLFSALCEWWGIAWKKENIISIVKDIESIILNKGPCGYQDYYPALFQGILCLKPRPGKIEVEQLYSEDLARYLEQHLILVDSKMARNSGINNWEVYKNFFDQKIDLKEIASLSFQTYQALRAKNYAKVLELISREGEIRGQLFQNILTPEIFQLRQKLKKIDSTLGIKVCGAGGGGHFLIVAPQGINREIEEEVLQHKMQIVPYSVVKG